MENFFLQAVADDLRRRLRGVSFGRVWQPTAASLVIDVRGGDGRFLAVSADPTDPGLFLSEREPVALEADSTGERAFASLLRKHLRGARLESIEKPPRERVVTFRFATFSTSGERELRDLVVALTGRSTNVWLSDAAGAVLGSLRPLRPDRAPLPPSDDRPLLTDLAPEALAALAPTAGDAAKALAGFGATLVAELAARERAIGLHDALVSLRGDLAAPVADARLYSVDAADAARMKLATFELRSLAGAAVETFPDPHRAADERARRRASVLSAVGARRAVVDRARTARTRTARAMLALDADLASIEGADRDRELAESLLAQTTTARLVAGGFEIVDYYSPDGAKVVVACDRGDTPQGVAERLFARHRKARRTREAVATRRTTLEQQGVRLDALVARAEAATEPVEIDAVQRDLDRALGVRKIARAPRGPAPAESVPGARRFVSSDGLEILVGRSSAANDSVTFKIGKPSDLWLHAADYPGSHVVIRNPSKAEIPHRSVLEAAQLAAFYSEARDDTLVDVRYTPRRFVTKPKGAPPGLVRLSRFKTVTVRPAADLDRAP